MKRDQGIGDPLYFTRYRREVELVLSPPYGPLLDIGGGTGVTAAALKRNHRIERVGVIDFAVEKGGFDTTLDFAITADLERSDAIEQAGRDHGPFGLVLCLDVLEHLIDPWNLYAWIKTSR